MKIELTEYNQVIDGLRTQLQLQRRLTAEKIETIKTCRDLIDHLNCDYRNQKARHDLEIRAQQDSCANLSRALAYARSMAEDASPILVGREHPDWSPAYQAVLHLRDRAEVAEEKLEFLRLAKLRTRKRK